MRNIQKNPFVAGKMTVAHLFLSPIPRCSGANPVNRAVLACCWNCAAAGIGCGPFGKGSEPAVSPGTGSSSLGGIWSSVHLVNSLILEQDQPRTAQGGPWVTQRVQCEIPVVIANVLLKA